MKFVTLVLVLALAMAEESLDTVTKRPVKRSYVCPPNFIRLSHRCYYFSRENATWQDAYFKCRELHGNLAVIRNLNQDKVIRRTLGRKTLAPLERWLGGLYDWEQMSWKWAASGKPLLYQGFYQPPVEDKESLRWHCIIVDPRLDYRWSTRSCVEEKHFICHTKIKVVTNKDKKKLLRQYNVDKFNQLNEIPVPVLPDSGSYNTTVNLKRHRPNGVSFEGQFASKPDEVKRKRKKNRKKNIDDLENNIIETAGIGVYDIPQREQAIEERRRRKKKRQQRKEMEMKWRTYLKDATVNPLHPKAIVEEFSYGRQP